MEFQPDASSIRKKKKLLKERRKQRERVALKMDLPGVSIADGGDSSMFSLSTINKQKVNAEETAVWAQMLDPANINGFSSLC